MIFRANIKSMPKYGYERDLGLGCRLLKASKQNCGRSVSRYNEKKGCGHWCRPLQKKKLLWVLPLDL